MDTNIIQLKLHISELHSYLNILATKWHHFELSMKYKTSQTKFTVTVSYRCQPAEFSATDTVFSPGRCWRGYTARRTSPCTRACTARPREATWTRRHWWAASTVNTGPGLPSGWSWGCGPKIVLWAELQNHESEHESKLALQWHRRVRQRLDRKV